MSFLWRFYCIVIGVTCILVPFPLHVREVASPLQVVVSPHQELDVPPQVPAFRPPVLACRPLVLACRPLGLASCPRPLCYCLAWSHSPLDAYLESEGSAGERVLRKRRGVSRSKGKG